MHASKSHCGLFPVGGRCETGARHRPSKPRRSLLKREASVLLYLRPTVQAIAEPMTKPHALLRARVHLRPPQTTTMVENKTKQASTNPAQAGTRPDKLLAAASQRTGGRGGGEGEGRGTEQNGGERGGGAVMSLSMFESATPAKGSQ